jgi:hypothetical protein
VYKVDLGGGAELRPLEPFQAEEFLAPDRPLLASGT